MTRRNLLLTSLCLILLGVFALACCCPVAIPLGNFGGNPDGTGTTTTTTDPETASVKGTAVINTNTDINPAPGLTVTIGAKTTTTDDNGDFEITGLFGGTYDVLIAGGDLGYKGSVTVNDGEAVDMGELELSPTLPLP